MDHEELEDQAWNAFDRYMGDDAPKYSRSWASRAVSTTKTSRFDDAPGPFFVMGVNTRRTFSETEEAAKDHAHNIIDSGDCDEMLIVKVVGRIYRKKTPVEYESFED